jgi:hypothetical protein
MTVEHRIIVGLGDIKAVCFECRKCKARAMFSTDLALEIPAECAQCHQKWSAGGQQTMKYRTYETVIGSFVESISGLLTITKENKDAFGFSVLLEFDDPAAK